jgi:hypothetical protein
MQLEMLLLSRTRLASYEARCVAKAVSRPGTQRGDAWFLKPLESGGHVAVWRRSVPIQGQGASDDQFFGAQHIRTHKFPFQLKLFQLSPPLYAAR